MNIEEYKNKCLKINQCAKDLAEALEDFQEYQKDINVEDFLKSCSLKEGIMEEFEKLENELDVYRNRIEKFI